MMNFQRPLLSIILTANCLALILSTRGVAAQSLNTDCDLSENALSRRAKREIPRRCITVNNRERCYWTYVPKCARGATPLVYDIHGAMYCPSTFFSWTGWMEKAEDECFAVAWPMGNTDPNLSDYPCFSSGCCCYTKGNADRQTDLRFLRRIGAEVADQVAQDSNGRVTIDGTRIYMSGHSNGCIAAMNMAMRESDFVAGVACMAGAWVLNPSSDYSARPIWHVMGEKDIMIPYHGGSGNTRSFSDAFKGLSKINGCRRSERVQVDVNSMNMLFEWGHMTTDTSTGCDNGATVQFITLNTAGHFPYRKPLEIAPPPPLAATTTVDTTSMAWNFLKDFSLDQPPPEFQQDASIVETPSPTPPPTVAADLDATLPPGMVLVTLPPAEDDDPTETPTDAPTTARPTTARPTTVEPATVQPTTVQPTTVQPTTVQPTTVQPTTVQPTTVQPTTTRPTRDPTTRPTPRPSTSEPTALATQAPVPTPPPTTPPTTVGPTDEPTDEPTLEPTTTSPSVAPSAGPSLEPSRTPSAPPSSAPSTVPSTEPSVAPTLEPSSMAPITLPTFAPSSSASTRTMMGQSWMGACWVTALLSCMMAAAVGWLY